MLRLLQLPTHVYYAATYYDFSIARILCLLCLMLCYSAINYVTNNSQDNKQAHFFTNIQLFQHTEICQISVK